MSRTMKGLRFYPTWKLTSESATVFIKDGRRCDNHRSETKDFFTPSTASGISISIFVSVSLVPRFQGDSVEGPIWMLQIK